MDKPRELVPLDAIASGEPAVASKGARDPKDEQEEDGLSFRRRRAEIGAIEQQNADRRATRVLRFRYAKAVYRYLCWYTGGTGAVVILAGFKPIGFSVSDAVLSIIVGSTAAAAIGLVGFVVQGLFKNSN